LKIRIRISTYGVRSSFKKILVSSEGVETGLTVRQVLEQSHIVATLGKNNFLKLDPAILLREAQNLSMFFYFETSMQDTNPDPALFFSGFQDAKIN
jgi:hypothetical protein